MDRVLCSSYNMAQQTASAVMTLFPDIALTLDKSIKPSGDVYSVLDAIDGLDVQHLLIVSHNPLLSNLLSVMVDGTMESAPLRRQRGAALRIYGCCSIRMR